MKLLEWIARWLEKRGALPTHHTKDPRLLPSKALLRSGDPPPHRSVEGRCYICPQCGHAIDTRYALKMISEEEIDELRSKILNMKYTRMK
jgi:hypothetical protein